MCTVFTLCTFQRQTILPCLIFIIQLGQSEMITKSEQYHVEVGDQGIVDYILPSIVKKRYLLKLAINSRCLECRCWLLHNWSQEGEEEGMREEEEVDITKLELHHTDWRIVRIEERGFLKWTRVFNCKMGASFTFFMLLQSHLAANLHIANNTSEAFMQLVGVLHELPSR